MVCADVGRIARQHAFEPIDDAHRCRRGLAGFIVVRPRREIELGFRSECFDVVIGGESFGGRIHSVGVGVRGTVRPIRPDVSET